MSNLTKEYYSDKDSSDSLEFNDRFKHNFDKAYEAQKNEFSQTESGNFADNLDLDLKFRLAYEKAYKAQQKEREGLYNNTDAIPEKNKKKKSRKILKIVLSILLSVICLYSIAIYSNIPFIAKWRTIYIETAMNTMNHKWLATMFIPKSVIDEVMLADKALDEKQAGLESNWSISNYSQKDLYLPWRKAKKHFSKIYSEIDETTFNAYIKKHSDEIFDEGGYLLIDKAGLKEKGTSIKTKSGDKVLAIDTKNAITIIKVEGDGYVGRLAIIKDPSRVGLGLSEGFDEKGAKIKDIAEYNDAVLAINASGFYDPNGKGNGGNVYGLVMSDGKLYKEAMGGSYKTIALDKKNKLNIGNYENFSSFRDAVEFKPALIINGKTVVSGTAGWGIHPRSAIGQTKNGEILLLIVDGRAPGYSIGCTVTEAAEIMKRYGAYQACNLDGGSSSLMYYNGREISRPSAANKDSGRSVPNGFVVFKKK